MLHLLRAFRQVHLEFLTELAAIRRRVQRTDTARLVKLGWALGPMQVQCAFVIEVYLVYPV